MNAFHELGGGAHTLHHVGEIDVVAERVAAARQAVGVLSAAVARTREPAARRRLKRELRRASAALATYRRRLERLTTAGMAPAATRQNTG